MSYSQASSPQDELLTEQKVIETLHKGLDGRFTHQSVLVLIPDHTRSLPLPFLFRAIVEILNDVRQLDFMVALGTHPALSEEALNKLVGITPEERLTKYKAIGLFNHTWDNPSALVSIGIFEADEIKNIARENWHPSLPEHVDIRINKAALEYDHILILGPTFPHEVAGFSGGAKYLFPGISGPEMINATHWLGALAGVVGTIGLKETPVREMIHAAARGSVLRSHWLRWLWKDTIWQGYSSGTWLILGTLQQTSQPSVTSTGARQPFQRVLSCAPAMYDELWTAAKAMYKLEPAVAVGGEVDYLRPTPGCGQSRARKIHLRNRLSHPALLS